MDGSPQLLTNIQFAEAKKGGYDRTQVDNFLHELSLKVGELQDMLRHATQRAEAAEAALADAEKAKAAALAEAAEARSTAATSAASAASEVEAATGVLAMAQKTADGTIREAEGKGEEIIAAAREQAGTIVVETEQQAERRKEEANAEVDRMVAERVTVIERDVERLSAQRDSLQLDVDLLRHYLDEHRAKIRGALDDINKLLDQPGALTPDAAPELGGLAKDTHVDSVSRPAAGAPKAEPEPAPEPASAVDAGDGPGPADVPSASTPSPSPAPATAAPVTVSVEPPAEAPVEDAGPTIVTVEDLSSPTPPAPAATPDPTADFPAVKAPEILGGDEPAASGANPIDLTAGGTTPSLFSSTDQPTQAYDVLADAEVPDASSLGTVDDDADEAMRAFFEQDLDESAKDTKRGFLRRR